uniref:Plasmid recombination enzyme n=1 Tax=uncultured prokaryote TaxID=198431 RepID=A0A0H5Q660_9ZZZZ|nr:hypothetical protein [uncultured prokaryote]
MVTKLVFNIERINRSQLRAQKRHDLREAGNLTHTNPHLVNPILHGTGHAVADVDAMMEAKAVKVRKDNHDPYTRVVLSASPDLFDDHKRTKKWLDDSMGFLRETWGEGFVYAVLHLDEKTPHIHAVVVPLVESKRGTISSHHRHPATKGLNSYERLRRTCSDRLELDYGEPGNKPRTMFERQALTKAAIILEEGNAMASEQMDRVDKEWSIVRAAKVKVDADREALNIERALLNRDRSEHAARARALSFTALALGEAELAQKARLLASPTRPAPAITIEEDHLQAPLENRRTGQEIER